MTAPVIVDLPSAPDRANGSTQFDIDATAWAAALAVWTTETNAVSAFCEAMAAIAESASQDLLATFTNYSGDANVLASSGMYKLAAGVTNAWSGAGDNDFLFNMYTDAYNQFQMGFDGANLVHIRSKISSVWGSWFELTGQATETVKGMLQLADQALAEAGVDDLAAMTPLKTKQAIDAQVVTACGVGQTWQDMTASRAATTSYQNTTGQPIQVILSNVATLRWFQVSTDNSTWVNVCEAGGSYARQGAIIVPDDHYYRLNGSSTIGVWAELR